MARRIEEKPRKYSIIETKGRVYQDFKGKK